MFVVTYLLIDYYLLRSRASQQTIEVVVRVASTRSRTKAGEKNHNLHFAVYFYNQQSSADFIDAAPLNAVGTDTPFSFRRQLTSKSQKGFKLRFST